MEEVPMVLAPQHWFAVFHRTSLPQHPDNPDADLVVPWPVLKDGREFMPMSGRFVVRGASDARACEDGFLMIREDGHPVWVAELPGEVDYDLSAIRQKMAGQTGP